MTRLSERLLARLRAEGVVPAGAENVEIHRTFASGSQRTQGAWSWFVSWTAGSVYFSAGSQWSMAACMRARKWDLSTEREFGFGADTSVDPSPEDRAAWRAGVRPAGVVLTTYSL